MWVTLVTLDITGHVAAAVVFVVAVSSDLTNILSDCFVSEQCL